MAVHADFSRQGTRKVLMRETLLYPVTLYGFGVALLGSLALLLFGVSWVTGIVTGVSFGVSLLSWVINYFMRAELYIKRHLDSLQKELERQKVQLTQKIGKNLRQLQPVHGAEEFVRQASAQFRLVDETYNSFQSLLVEKFSPTEITYGRYLGAAEQIYLSVLDQLDHIVSLFKSIETTDLKHVNARLEELRAKSNQLSPDDQDEKTALEKRAKIVEGSLKEIDEMLSRNEEALTSLDIAKAAIAALKTSRGQASTELPMAIRDLEDLAERSKQYSINAQ